MFRAELPWRLAPCSDLIRVPRLTADYSGSMASPLVGAAEISHTAFMLHPLERPLEYVLAIRGDKFLDGMLAWHVAIWAEWVHLDCYSSSSNWFYLETGLGLPRQFLGPVTIYTASSPWKTTQAYLGMSSVSAGCHVGCYTVWSGFVSFFCLCLQMDHMVTFRLKTSLKSYEYFFPRKIIKMVNDSCYISFFWMIFPNAISRLNKENLSILLISCSPMH